jgi:hypothetical protein
VSPVLRFTLTYVAAFTTFSVAAGDRRIVAYLIVLGVLGAAAHAIHRRVRFSPTVQWALATAGLLHLTGGLLPGHPIFYETWLVPGVLKYDQVVHFTISAVATVAAAHMFRGRLRPAVALALALGLANEVFEALSAARFADAYAGALTNTAWDLVFNSFGVAAAAVYLYGLPRGRTTSMYSDVTAMRISRNTTG